MFPLVICACSTIPLTGHAPNDVSGDAEIGRQDQGDTRFATLSLPQMTVWAVHDPIYSDLEHDGIITARAEHASSELAQIRIDVTIGTVTDCAELNAGNPPSVIPCRGGATSDSVTCPFPPGTATGECPYALHVMTDSLISYRATATSALGLELSSPTIAFSGGTPGAGQIRPIWWHTDTATGTNNVDRISIGLFPDADYVQMGNGLAGFAIDVNEIVGEAYFNDLKSFAREYTANRNFFDLWVGPLGADASSDCIDFAYDESAAPARAVIHAGAIVHWNPFEDCADINFPGDGSVSANDFYNSWLLVHESGHFAFGLGDEHESGGHFSCSSPANVFDDHVACITTLAGIVAPDTAKCVGIPGTSKFRIDENLTETMLRKKLFSGFRTSSGNAIVNRFEACRAGHCFSGGSAQCPGN